jgi:hypothetical protein
MRYLFLTLFSSLALMGAEEDRRTKIHWWKRESIVPYPQRPLTIVGMTSQAAPAIYPAPEISTEDEGMEAQDLDAIEIESEIDRYLVELRNQDNNDEQPGAEPPDPVQREASQRNVHVPVVPPTGRTFWDRIAAWCSYDRRGRR